MKLFIASVSLGLICSCSLRHPVNVSDGSHQIRVSPGARLSLDTIQEIVDSRGGKEDGETWLVDRYKTDVRIRKSRNGSDPNHDIELWYLDSDGTWSQRKSF